MDILDQDAGTILAAIRAGDLTCESLMQATLDRIKMANPTINAVVSLRDPDLLMAEARAADAVPLSARGSLHGLPFAVKDLASLSGVRWTDGSPIHADRIADRDELMVERLRKAGVLFIGKTNVPDLGLGSHSYNRVFGVTRNPYDSSKTAGGSSGGAAAALATGIVALADGSDMMGSLRNPAGFCNVYGFRPSWGVVPRNPGTETFLQQLSTLGPMARSPSDMALMMDVVAGPNPLVPHNATVQDWGLEDCNDLTGLRIGWLGDWSGAYQTEPGILDLCQEGLGRLASLGARVDPLPAPFPASDLWDSWTILRHWAVATESKHLFEDTLARDQLKPEAQWEIERGLALTATDISRAGATRARWFETLATLFNDRFDMLALPTAQVWPFDATWNWPKCMNKVEMDTYHRWMEVVIPVSLAGVPCVSVPLGLGETGLPMGLQLFAQKGADRALLQWAETYHQATKYPQKLRPHIQGG